MLIEESRWKISGCSLHSFFNFAGCLKIFLLRREKSNSNAAFEANLVRRRVEVGQSQQFTSLNVNLCSARVRGLCGSFALTVLLTRNQLISSYCLNTTRLYGFCKGLAPCFQKRATEKCLQTPYSSYLFCSSLRCKLELACLRNGTSSELPKLGGGCRAGGQVGLVHELVNGRPGQCGEVGWSFYPRV